jgi:cytochrome b involved in lipid metabolism
MAPPPKPNLMAPPMKPTTSLMPPPRVAPSNLRALPTSSQSMRVPTTGPLPNRGPVPNRGPPVSNGSLGLSPSGRPTANTPNARNKVLLSPGHSPLDWAHLQKSGKNLSGVDTLMRVTPTMLKEKNGRKGKPAWSAYQGKVYNISPYLPFHPGGEGELRRCAGKDGTKLFMEVHPWVNWETMLGECMVGIMVSEEPVPIVEGSLEDMD